MFHTALNLSALDPVVTHGTMSAGIPLIYDDYLQRRVVEILKRSLMAEYNALVEMYVTDGMRIVFRIGNIKKKMSRGIKDKSELIEEYIIGLLEEIKGFVGNCVLAQMKIYLRLEESDYQKWFCSTSSLVLDNERGALVEATVRVERKGLSAERSAAAFGNHSEAEKKQ
ncbi:unnamed protein product [Dovyalis caffra]|uniref:Uncharacterized protein n=2 Tax=Dovyalis caffra TaxID=77055 RepID=A0AAV1QV81_9ROSI|nr:unnamed protein product [Dovyalis caffra]